MSTYVYRDPQSGMYRTEDGGLTADANEAAWLSGDDDFAPEPGDEAVLVSAIDDDDDDDDGSMRYQTIDRCTEPECGCLDSAGIILYDGEDREAAESAKKMARYPEPRVNEVLQ